MTTQLFFGEMMIACS